MRMVTLNHALFTLFILSLFFYFILFVIVFCFIIEVLFEPDTTFRVLSVGKDEKRSGVTRVRVEVQETEPVLEDLINTYVKNGLLLW